jgi:hypothetical protein
MAFFIRENMKTKKFTVTLSRAHTVMNRFKEKRTELKKEIETLLAPKTIALTSGMSPDVLKGLMVESDIVAKLQLMHDLSAAIGTIKTKVAELNASFGVNALLASNDGYSFMMTLTKEAIAKLNGEDSGKASVYRMREKEEDKPVAATELEGILDKLSMDPEAKTFNLKVSRVPANFVDELKRIHDEYQQLSFAAMDEVNDKNKEKVALELSVDILPYSGLVVK